MITGVQMVLCLALLAQSGEMPLSQRIGQLDSSDYAQRQSATQLLMQSQVVTDEQLDDFYQKATSPEQKNRLEQIALHRVLRQWVSNIKVVKSAGGSVGIQIYAINPKTHPLYEQGGIWIKSTLPGFPAHELLHVGDLIVAVNGMPVSAKGTGVELTKVFISLIEPHPTGSSIEFTVMRGSEAMQVQCPIAPKTALMKLYPPKGTVQLSPMGFRLWQKRFETLSGQASKATAQHMPNPADELIPIEWQANAAQ